ncbi:hypothetical protein ACWGDE_04530 [Streptomyces sp. NPDC054956]
MQPRPAEGGPEDTAEGAGACRVRVRTVLPPAFTVPVLRPVRVPTSAPALIRALGQVLRLPLSGGHADVLPNTTR